MGSNYVPGGFTYREDITEKLGIDMSQVTKPEDLTEVFAKRQYCLTSFRCGLSGQCNCSGYV